MYNYKAKVLSVYDADTMTLDIDLGCDVHIKEKVRVFGIDTPELRTKDLDEKKAGYEARDFVRKLLLKKTITIRTIKDKKGKFGRYLVDIVLLDKSSLSDVLVEKKMARRYFGEKKKPFKDWFK